MRAATDVLAEGRKLMELTAIELAEAYTALNGPCLERWAMKHLSALLAVAEVAVKRQTQGHDDHCPAVLTEPHRKGRPCNCYHDETETALNLLTK